MTLLVMGGHDRLESHLQNYAEEKKLKLKFINKPSQNLEDAVSKADLVIVITPLVSHEMVKIAKKYGCEKCIFCKQKGLCHIKDTIERVLRQKNLNSN